MPNESPSSEVGSTQLEGADTLLDDTVDDEAGDTLRENVRGAGAYDANGAGNGPEDEEDEEEDDDGSDPPPRESNAADDREINEDPDNSDAGEGEAGGRNDEVGFLGVQNCIRRSVSMLTTGGWADPCPRGCCCYGVSLSSSLRIST